MCRNSFTMEDMCHIPPKDGARRIAKSSRAVPGIQPCRARRATGRASKTGMRMGSWRSFRTAAARCLFATLAIGSLARADLIYFRQGGDAQIPATIAGNRVLVSMPDGQVELVPRQCAQAHSGFLARGRVAGAPAPGDGSRFRRAVRGCLVGARKRLDEGGGSRDTRASSARPKACAVRANGSHARSARSAVPRPGFNRVSKGPRHRGECGPRAARHSIPSTFGSRGGRANRTVWKR